MPVDLGKAILTIAVKADDFRKGIGKAKTETDQLAEHVEKKTGKIRGAFDKVGASAKNAAGKVPFVGGALASMVTPAGAATAAIGLVVGGLTKAVTKTLDLGRRLGELREATGVSAEGIQIWQRAIEETNGDAGAFDDVVLRLQKSIGDAAGGSKGARDAFDRLGLSWKDLADKSPEEAMAAVIARSNETQNASDGASTKALLLGRSYTKLGGLANMTGAELTALTAEVADNAAIMSGKGVDAVDDYDTASREMRDSFGSIVTQIGMALIPILTDLFGVIKQAMPVIKILIDVALIPLETAVRKISTVFKIVSALLKGDFTGALNHAKNYFLDTATSMLDIGAKIVGLFNKDMAASIQGLSDDMKAMKTEFESDMTDVETSSGDAAAAIASDAAQSAEALASVGAAAAETANEWQQMAQQIIDSTKRQEAELIASYNKQQDAAVAHTNAIADLWDRVAEENAASLRVVKTQIDVIDDEMDEFYTAHDTKIGALIARAKSAAAEIDAATGGGSGGDRPDRGFGSTGGVAGGSSKARPAPGPVTLDPSAGDIVDAYPKSSLPEFGYFKTTTSGPYYHNLLEFPQRRADVAAWMAAGGIPSAQHGALIEGVNNGQGRTIRVGENNTDEMILPLPAGMLNALRSGGRQSSAETMVAPLQIGDETIAEVVATGNRILLREKRA